MNPQQKLSKNHDAIGLELLLKRQVGQHFAW